MTHYDAEGARRFTEYVKEKTDCIQGAAERLRCGSPVELGYLLEKAEDLLRFLEREHEMQTGRKTERQMKIGKDRDNIDTLETYIGLKFEGYFDLPTDKDDPDAVDDYERTPYYFDKFDTCWYKDRKGRFQIMGEDKSKLIGI